MTFRVDDLFVTVLPENLAAVEDCAGCTKRTGGPTPCASNDQNTDNQCVPCNRQSCTDQTGCNDTNCISGGTKKKSSWRDEQFALLSGELETALAR